MRDLAALALCSALLLRVENQAENVETELRELQTHSPELVLGFVTEDMGTSGPELCDWLANLGIFGLSVSIDVLSVCQLARSCAAGAVNLLVSHLGKRG